MSTHHATATPQGDKGTEDAWFVLTPASGTVTNGAAPPGGASPGALPSKSVSALGVADGVGGWSEANVDSGAYRWEVGWGGGAYRWGRGRRYGLGVGVGGWVGGWEGGSRGKMGCGETDRARSSIRTNPQGQHKVVEGDALWLACVRGTVAVLAVVYAVERPFDR